MIIANKVALDVINEGLKTGADEAEIFAENKITHSVTLSHKRVDSNTSRLIYGAGIRLLKDGKQVYGYTSDLSKKSLLNLAANLAASFEGSRKHTLQSFSTVKNPNAHKIKISHTSQSNQQKIDYLKRAEGAIYAVSPLIVNAYCSLLESDQKVEIFNSNGRFVSDSRIRTRLFFESIASKDGMYETAYEAPGGSEGLELLERINPEEYGKEVGNTAVELLSAPECPSGKMTVIIGNKFGGVIFHEACGHPLEGTAISHKTSVFTGKRGQKIASDLVSAMDDGTIPNAWGSSNFDDEGEPTTQNLLIKDGILQNYMVDNFDGKRLNLPSTGSCRRTARSV